MFNQPLYSTLKTINSSYRKQLVFARKARSAVSIYFLNLRAMFDHEINPVLIVDRRSGFILSLNLSAFELLSMNVVGFKFVDFMNEPNLYQQLVAPLDQTRKTHCIASLHNADGRLMTCQMTITTAPRYTGWLVVRLSENQA